MRTTCRLAFARKRLLSITKPVTLRFAILGSRIDQACADTGFSISVTPGRPKSYASRWESECVTAVMRRYWPAPSPHDPNRDRNPVVLSEKRTTAHDPTSTTARISPYSVAANPGFVSAEIPVDEPKDLSQTNVARSSGLANVSLLGNCSGNLTSSSVGPVHAPNTARTAMGCLSIAASSFNGGREVGAFVKNGVASRNPQSLGVTLPDGLGRIG